MTVEQQVEKALLLNEDLYFLTPTKELFEIVLNIFNTKFKKYVPDFKRSDWKLTYWDSNKEKTHLYYVQNDSLYWGGDIKHYPNLKQIHITQENSMIKDKLEEALIKGEEFYIHTPTPELFEEIVKLFKNELKEYVILYNPESWIKERWDMYKTDTYLFYESNKEVLYGSSESIVKSGYNLFSSEEKIIEHTYTISIGEYSGKLIIPKEALQLLKDGTKIKIV